MAETVPPAIDTRSDAEAFLDERIGSGVRPGLERITGLLDYLGQPQEIYPTILVAGTNGKTTVVRMVQQILGAHGLTTAGFTSPHLGVVEERFALHGAPIDAERFTESVRDIAWFVTKFEQDTGQPVTYFEVTTAVALSLMAAEAVDVGVVEVGLGGRLDATNVLVPEVAVVTGIDIDHTEFLGTTVRQIAAEKAAILKNAGTLVTGALPTEAFEVAADRVAQTQSTWIASGRDFSVTEAVVGVGGWQCGIEGVFDEYPELFLPLHGRHQVDNLATAIAASEMFLGRALDHGLLTIAVASMRAPGRLEVVDRRPVVLIDGCHNEQGFRGLAATLDHEFPPLPWKLVFAVRGERDVDEMLAPLSGYVSEVFATTLDDPAARPAEDVAAEASKALGVPAHANPDPMAALSAAVEAAGPDGGVLVAGSLYLVGAVRSQFDVHDDAPIEAHLRFEAQRLGLEDGEASDEYGEGPEEQGTPLG